jgi:hypothetical protein
MAQQPLPERQPVTDEEGQAIVEFQDWLSRRESGMRIYYTGDLATDAFFRDFPDAIRSLAWAAMRRGHVRLFQRRKQFTVFEYLAIKRAPLVIRETHANY